jgi:1-acyl-sn-glycerol-3-phosphate acyltransferase
VSDVTDEVAVELDPVRKRDLLKSAALWGVGVSWMVPMLTTMGVLNATVLPSNKTEGLNRLYCKGQVALTGSRWRKVVHPDVDPDQPYLFAQNHTNLFDHVALYNATPHFKQGLELQSHFKIPVYGWFMKARGTIGVRPGKQGQTPEIMDHMRSEVAKGHSILAFPEGHRTKTGRVGPFRKGVFFIARDLGLPIAPVAVTGMYRVNRKGSWLIRPGHTVTVYVEQPIETKGIPDEGIGELAERVREVIAARIDAYWRGELA